MDLQGKYKKLDYINKKYFSDYLRHMQLRNIQQTTITTKLWKVYGFLLWFDMKDAKTARPEDLENFYLHRKQTKSAATAYGDIQELAVYYHWLLPDREVITFKPQRPRHDLPPEKVLQSDNVRSLLEACESQRDRALVALVWDSAARISEVLDTNIGHVRFDQYGAVISVKGKTGRRNIRLVSSVPDLQAWINIHPMRNNPDAPLFVTSRRRGTTTLTRLTPRRVQNIFARLGDLAACPKDTNPHAFRHGRLTSRGSKLTEAELREYAGWSSRSAMASIYVHLSSRDIDNKILQVEGKLKDEEPAPDPMAPVLCPRCKHENAPDARFCNICSMTMNDRVAKELEDAQKQAEQLPEYKIGMDKLQADINRLTAQVTAMQKS